MSNALAWKEQLEKAKREEKIIRLTAEQIIRDFSRFGLEVHFSGEASLAYGEPFSPVRTTYYRVDGEPIG